MLKTLPGKGAGGSAGVELPDGGVELTGVEVELTGADVATVVPWDARELGQPTSSGANKTPTTRTKLAERLTS